MAENELLSNEAQAAEASAAMDAQTAEAPEPSASPTAPASLVLLRGGAETDQVFPFAPPAVIGRFDPAVGPIEVDLGEIDEGKYVSRKHARITLEDGVWRIHDMGSSNGTYVLRSDFERVDEADLSDGVQIALGNARFKFCLSENSGSMEPSADENPEDGAASEVDTESVLAEVEAADPGESS